MTIHNKPPRTSDLQQALLDRLTLGVGVAPDEATLHDWFQATALTVREQIVKRFHETKRLIRRKRLKQVSYLSMEFLLGQKLEHALLATGLLDECREALAANGIRLDDVLALEVSPALGNGGLGRLAACFLDSAASLGLPCVGYGIRYRYGMFRQEIVDGWQVEKPDAWLDQPCPWEFLRPERVYRIRFGGRVEHRGFRAHWLDTEDILAVAHDTLVPGTGHFAVNTLRLWSAKPAGAIDLHAFNRGAFLDAQLPEVRSKTVSSVLYPDDSTMEGRELRLRQEHFFVSASVQDIVARFRAEYDDWSLLPEKVSIHLNDTHPALAPVELMRLLIDEHQLEWVDAWNLVSATFSYTNHTLMPEALEVWPVSLMQRVLPRHYEIISEINRRFVAEVSARPEASSAVHALELVEGGERVNMGRLSVLASRRINGVSELHSRLVRERLFADFARLYPERFDNVTNGITPRRWLIQSNPALADLIDEAIGHTWRQNLEELAALEPFADDARFRSRLAALKHANKQRLAKDIRDRVGVAVEPAAIFDVQIKRIHEYKRQLLTILGVIAQWNAMHAEPGREWPARVVVMAGKAASAYRMAKLIIKLAHDVGARINSDPLTADRLKLVFLPNYNVPLAERIIPAADLSEQISLAGTEASGTGNMKLALNGALTIGTADGANVEIAEAVGAANIFTFGMTVDEVAALRASGYQPRAVYERDPRLRQAIDQIANGEFSPDDRERFRPIVDALLDSDTYMLLADFPSYWEAQRLVERTWLDTEGWRRKSVLNIAGSGRFSSDRAIREYVDKIWYASLLDD